jgi:hypothetical protein
MRTSFLICILAFVKTVCCQEVEVTWGGDIKISKKERYLEIIGGDQSSFYTTRDLYGSNREFILERYNSEDLSLLSKRTILLPEIDGQTMEFDQLFFLNDSFYLFTSFYNNTIKANEAYCCRLNKSGDWLDIPQRVDMNSGLRRNLAGFEVILSSDSSLFLVRQDLRMDRKNNERLAFKVYDLELNLQWEKELELPYSDDVLEIDHYALSPGGNVYMMTGISQEKTTAEGSIPSVREKHYVMLSYDWKNNKLKEFDVGLKNKWIMSATFDMTRTGDLAVGGFYSNNQSFSIAGTFFFLLDGRTQQLKSSGLKAFDEKLLKRFMSDSRAEKGKELPNVYFDHFILNPDSTAYLIGEQFKISERVMTDPTTGRPVVSYYYNYDDIIVVKLSSEGQVQWATSVRKEQSTTGDLGAYSSYAPIRNGDNILFLFNDHPDNTAKLSKDINANLSSFTNHKKSVAVLVTLDNEGKESRKALFSQKDSETILKPKLYFQQHDHEVILYGQYRKNYKFGKLVFK